MSHTAVAGFLGKVVSDPSRLRELTSAVRDTSADEAGAAMAAMGAASGYDFSAAEALAVCAQLAAGSPGFQAEDDEVLEGVRGGVGVGAAFDANFASFNSLPPELMEAFFQSIEDKGGAGPVDSAQPTTDMSQQFIDEQKQLMQNVLNMLQDIYAAQQAAMDKITRP